MSPAINKMKKNNNSKGNMKKPINKSKLKTKQRQFIIQKQNNKNTSVIKNNEDHQKEVNVENGKVETNSKIVNERNTKLKKGEETADYSKKQDIHNNKRKLEEASQKITSAKHKKRKKNKVKSDSADTSTYKPITLNTTEYSANWNQLKDIIAKSDKKIDKDQLNNKKGSKEKLHIKSKSGKTSKDGKGKSKKVAEVKKINEKPDIWFDDVDPILLESNVGLSNDENDSDPNEKESKEVYDIDNDKTLVKDNSFLGGTKCIAMDCEMVGVGSQFSRDDSILARVSLVNHFGQVLYDTFVKPTEKVTDYRTEFSGVRPGDMESGEDFTIVQKKVSEFMNNRILVGHALHNDLKVLFLSHPRNKIRDTSKYRGFRKLFGGRNPSLKKLTEKLMGVQIQKGEHSSIQDAQAAMRLYTLNRKEWEGSLKKRRVIKKDK